MSIEREINRSIARSLVKSVGGAVITEKVLSKEQRSALAKTPIYAKHFPKVGPYALSTNVPGFNRQNGWAICKFVCTTVPTAGASQYPFVINDGGTVNSIGLRINNAATPSNAVSMYNRSSSVSKTNETGKYPVYAAEVKTAGLVWRDDGYQLLIVDDTLDYSTQTDARNGTMTELYVGARNGGSDAFNGYVVYLEIGNEAITAEQLVARMNNARTPIVVATAGQSNIQNWDDGVETTAPKGREGLLSQLITTTAINCPSEVVFCGGAEGGSSLWSILNATEYWLTDGGGIGPELQQFFDKMDGSAMIPDFIIWDQGESESHFIDHASYPWLTKNVYKARLLTVFNHFWSKYPLARIGIGILGRRDSFTNTGGIQKIVEAQLELIAEYPHRIFFSHNRHDLTVYTDGVHYYDASYLTMGGRAGRKISRLMGYPVSGGTDGPILVSASRVGTALTITIAHDGGTDFTPTTAIEGFKYIDGSGNNVALSSVARASATTITATLASGVAGTLYHIYDDAWSVATANMIKDNGAYTLPLQRGKVTVV